MLQDSWILLLLLVCIALHGTALQMNDKMFAAYNDWKKVRGNRHQTSNNKVLHPLNAP